MRLNERQGGGRTYESGAANEREFGKKKDVRKKKTSLPSMKSFARFRLPEGSDAVFVLRNIIHK